MAKGFKENFLVNNDKTQKRIDKMLNKKDQNSYTVQYYSVFREEATRATALDYPDIRIVVTDSFVCGYIFTMGWDIEIIPLSVISNVYRTNMMAGKYDYNNLWLAVEHDDKKSLLGGKYRNGDASFDAFAHAVSTIKSRRDALIAGGQ